MRLEAVDEMTGAGMSLMAASEDLRQHKIIRSEKAGDVTQSISDQASRVESQADLYQAIGELMSRLDPFRGIVNSLSEVSTKNNLDPAYLKPSSYTPSSPWRGMLSLVFTRWVPCFIPMGFIGLTYRPGCRKGVQDRQESD